MGLYKILFYFLSADIHSNPEYNVGRGTIKRYQSWQIVVVPEWLHNISPPRLGFGKAKLCGFQIWI